MQTPREEFEELVEETLLKIRDWHDKHRLSNEELGALIGDSLQKMETRCQEIFPEFHG